MLPAQFESDPRNMFVAQWVWGRGFWHDAWMHCCLGEGGGCMSDI